MTASDILVEFPRKSALVVGDICLDRWCTYDPAFTEASRETGIDRLAVVSTEVTPGGGGTVGNNLASLGVGRVAVLGVLGNDGFGHELIYHLHSRGISTDLLVRSESVPTFTYTKLLNLESGREDQPRVDFINTRSIPEPIEGQILNHLSMFAGEFDVIYVADQAETRLGGIVTPAVRDLIQELAATDPEKVIWVDSRIRSHLFRRVILKPNRREAESASNEMLGMIDYCRFRKAVEAKLMFITQGINGALVVTPDGETLVPGAAIDNPVDICGAGDGFSAGAGMALEITGSPLEAARFGNLVAGITIMKKGTGTASPEEVRAEACKWNW